LGLWIVLKGRSIGRLFPSCLLLWPKPDTSTRYQTDELRAGPELFEKLFEKIPE
jgi:hypothetical protein